MDYKAFYVFRQILYPLSKSILKTLAIVPNFIEISVSILVKKT